MLWSDKTKKYLKAIMLIAFVFILIKNHDSIKIETIVESVHQISMPMMILSFVTIYILKSMIMVIPIVGLYMAAGAVFPLLWAIVITYMCLVITLSINYMMGKKLGKEKIYTTLSKQKNVAKFVNNHKNSLLYLGFVSRILPLPIELISILCGAINMPFLNYLAASLSGLSIMMIPFVLAGSYASNPMSIEFLVIVGISLAIAATIFVVFKSREKRNQNKG